MAASYHCNLCDKNVGAKYVIKPEKYMVKGKPIEVEAKICVCMFCHEEIFDPELDSENLRKAFAIYREKNILLTPEEITAIRESKGLTQEELTKTLGWEDKSTIARIEKGAIQEDWQNAQLVALRDGKKIPQKPAVSPNA